MSHAGCLDLDSTKSSNNLCLNLIWTEVFPNQTLIKRAQFYSIPTLKRARQGNENKQAWRKVKEHTPNSTTTTTTTTTTTHKHTHTQSRSGKSILRPAPEHLAFSHISEELMTHIHSRGVRESTASTQYNMISSAALSIRYYFTTHSGQM